MLKKISGTKPEEMWERRKFENEELPRLVAESCVRFTNNSIAEVRSC
jgi:hypothetical protein